ncbi:MAG: hypothetical protein V4487_04395 [Chlamydiota bacterium]
MAVIIRHIPNRVFDFGSCVPNVRVDIHASVKKRLKPGEELTNEVALRIFKQIKWTSSVKMFITAPIVLIAFGALIKGLAYLIFPIVSVACKVINLLGTCFIAAGILGGCCFSDGFFSNLSAAYKDEREQAVAYIEILKNPQPGTRFVL